MSCDDARSLLNAHLDSELDTRTTVELERHLKSCPDCRTLFADEARLEAALRAGLHRGQQTPALWKQIERSVALAADTGAAAHFSPGARNAAGGRGLFGVLAEPVRAGWQRSRWVWSALAAGWAVILSFNLASRETAATASRGSAVPPASEVRQAMRQKRLLTTSLALLPEPLPPASTKPASDTPRSERRSEKLNS